MNEEIEQFQEISFNKSRLKRQMTTLAWGVFALTMGAQVLALIPSYIINHFIEQGLDVTLGTWLATDLSIYGIGLPMLYLIIKDLPKKLPTKQNQNWSFTTYLKIILIALGSVYFFNIISMGITQLIATLFKQEVSTAIQDAINSTASIYTFIFVVLLAPIGEEFVFRKLLIDHSLQIGERFAIIFSAVCFGLFHANINQLFYAIFLGLILGYLYVKTADIKISILVHFLTNLIGSFLIPLLAVNEQYSNIAVGIIVVLIVISIILIVLNCKKVKLDNGTLPLTNKEKRQLMFKNAGFITYATIMVILIIMVMIAPYLETLIA